MASRGDSRLLELEVEAHRVRIRFRWALIGYLILAIGVIIAFRLEGSSRDRIEKNQRATIELVGRGQVLDCLEREELRADLGAVGITVDPGRIECAAIRRAFADRLDQLED